SQPLCRVPVGAHHRVMRRAHTARAAAARSGAARLRRQPDLRHRRRGSAELPGAAREPLLCIGGNDFLRRLGNEQAERNVRAMIELARRRGIDVLLIGTPEPGLFPSPPAFYAAVAKDLHIPYEGDVITEVLKDARLKSDPIHPNAAGYHVIAERVAAALKKNGAL